MSVACDGSNRGRFGGAPSSKTSSATLLAAAACTASAMACCFVIAVAFWSNSSRLCLNSCVCSVGISIQSLSESKSSSYNVTRTMSVMRPSSGFGQASNKPMLSSTAHASKEGPLLAAKQSSNHGGGASRRAPVRRFCDGAHELCHTQAQMQRVSRTHTDATQAHRRSAPCLVRSLGSHIEDV
jgi:hypothetical protein